MIVDVDEAVRLLKLGRVVSYPTETAFAFGADATNRYAVDAVYNMKKRLKNQKMPVLVTSVDVLDEFMEVPEVVRYLSKKLHPGPVNITIATKYPWIGAFRVSSHPTANSLVGKVGKPLVATSANLSGKPPAYSHQEVREHFDVPVVEGKLRERPVSTIFNPDREKFIRVGEVSQAEVLSHHYAFKALKKVRPSKKTVKLVGEVVGDVLEEARKIHPDVICGGSTAKGTYLDHVRDVDFYFLFDPEKISDLEETIDIMKGVAGKFGRVRVEYAQHPYLKVPDYKGMELEFVAAYQTEKGQVISAADRSAWHVGWVKALPPAVKDEILIAKQFCMGVGAYGADLAVEGFSGYSIEVLVSKNRGFVTFLEDMAHREWPISEEDPVDPDRNVLACVGPKTFQRFQRAARAYLGWPSMRFFFPHPVKILDRLEQLKNLVMVKFEKPDVAVDDAAWGMAKRYAKKMARVAGREGYVVKRHRSFVGRQVLVLFELEQVKQHFRVMVGPPRKAGEHFNNFTDKYPDYFMVGDRAWAFAEPRFQDFGELVEATEDKIGEPEIYQEGEIQRAYSHYYPAEKKFVCEFLLNQPPWEVKL